MKPGHSLYSQISKSRFQAQAAMWLLTFTAFATNAATTTAANTIEIIIFFPFNGDALRLLFSNMLSLIFTGAKVERNGTESKFYLPRILFSAI
ncbi:hypothetical protein HMPREF9141_1457 [Prevotella multiformis DSM 16608]|uniref:Uncharacterized protein n=1 Tax=Prevotella multiformis DSM 16608 TaxID=888743 RepID=F0F790_9BACT|nr:hypothetical protein HMPREF9141_1457 [Prevotella multiformis DSM 16608]